MTNIKSDNDFALASFTPDLNEYAKQYDSVEKINERLLIVRKAIRMNPRRNSFSIPESVFKTDYQETNDDLLSDSKDERDYLLYLRSEIRKKIRAVKKRKINAIAYDKRSLKRLRQKHI